MASRAVYYDLYDSGRLNGRYRAAELLVLLGMRRRQQIEHYSDAGILYQGRYTIVRVDDGMDDLLDDLVRTMDDLRALGYDLGQMRFVRIRNPHNPKRKKLEGGDADGQGEKAGHEAE